MARPPDAPTPAAPGVPPNPYANYRINGFVVNLPQPNNTVDLQLGGYRQKLADDYDIGYFGLSQTTFFSNVLNHAQATRGAQVYVGRKPAILSQNLLALIFDLTRSGIPDGQVVAAGSEQTTSWNPLGPNTISLGQLQKPAGCVRAASARPPEACRPAGVTSLRRAPRPCASANPMAQHMYNQSLTAAAASALLVRGKSFAEALARPSA